jgi:hypothetical protein
MEHQDQIEKVRKGIEALTQSPSSAGTVQRVRLEFAPVNVVTSDSDDQAR